MIKIIEISGDSCANCHAMLPELNAVAQANGLTFERIDLENEPSAAEKYNVVRVPTVVLEDDGVPFASCSGYQPAEILSLWVEAMLEEHSGDR